MAAILISVYNMKFAFYMRNPYKFLPEIICFHCLLSFSGQRMAFKRSPWRPSWKLGATLKWPEHSNTICITKPICYILKNITYNPKSYFEQFAVFFRRNGITWSPHDPRRSHIGNWWPYCNDLDIWIVVKINCTFGMLKTHNSLSKWTFWLPDHLLPFEGNKYYFKIAHGGHLEEMAAIMKFCVGRVTFLKGDPNRVCIPNMVFVS